ncbi:hypothetical protein BIFADO_00028 [Bifidobacterium adolescentis L2-32]|uniref:Uncharacterized protein n=1 Tax=Bifidobacterium adolescentis L2-32 TaxID=411481 RepID=A7A2K0_BIFAD|nr:hypothetical protein BIFADO_00028 [Bifidobacterium adolescentis L2-32]
MIASTNCNNVVVFPVPGADKITNSLKASVVAAKSCTENDAVCSSPLEA